MSLVWFKSYGSSPDVRRAHRIRSTLASGHARHHHTSGISLFRAHCVKWTLVRGSRICAALLLSIACVPPAASSSASPSPTFETLSATSAVTASPPAAPKLTFDNPMLGYGIAFPSGYRRSASRISAGGDEGLGRDDYTLLSEAGARALCLQDAGDIPLDYPQRESEVGIRVSRNVRHLSVMEWVATPQSTGAQPLSTHQKVERLTIGGLEAVRLVTDNVFAETTLFVISANDRMYVISPDFWRQPSSLPKGWLDEIANSFVAVAPGPFPSASPTTPPLIATRAVADPLAGAFAARDADAIARLMPNCRITVFPAVDGVSASGPLNRSTASFVDGLRARFAAGDLTVTVDPTVRVATEFGEERYWLSSLWREPDMTTRVDLGIAEIDGRWAWSMARHNYTVGEMRAGKCSLARRPWSATGTTSYC